ncbi:hypothetical protein ACRXCV_05390 [Halobacteriovorax sp. GFR7]|uniref:hypothetical protein n=1 Tax=unclassified Halobacteriovorax TaxID=2639665 RepID=UPI003D97A82A
MYIRNRLVIILKSIVYLVGIYNLFYLSNYVDFIAIYIFIYIVFHNFLCFFLVQGKVTKYEFVKELSIINFYILPIVIYFSMESTDKTIYDFLFSANFYKNMYVVLKSMF